jgi:hypothetical protein
MGADFLYAIAPAAILTARRQKELKNIIAKCELKDFEDHSFDDRDLAKCREQMLDDVDELVDFNGRRDAGTLGLHEMPYLCHISGGMSWGDSPTDAFSILARVGACAPVWRALEGWARKDKEEK